MAVKFICYSKCSTCKKAQTFLEDNKIEYTLQDIKTQNPTVQELADWVEKGVPVNKLFNTSGLLYREKNLKEKLPHMTQEEKLTLLATDGMLVKRPIAVKGNTVLVGFKPAQWEILK
ncbi:MAG: arsenate reductase family protein [Oscillospiraceae bacterium]|nr:arsenate reductase family protein [Oscillospiraceae bacterium]